MLRKNRLFTPGPTPLLPAAQFAEASFTAHHRTADFRNLFTRVLADMKEFIGTQNDVLVLACSGTGVMEAAVSNLTSPGDKMLVLTAGKFGERWTALGKAYGCQVDTLSKPYGETFSLDEVRSRLTPDVRAVYVQATETSTGARHDVKGIAKLVRATGNDTLLVVDAITGLLLLTGLGLAGFWGEVLALLSSYNPLSALSSHTFRAYMVAGGIGTVLTAGYFLWMLQRVNLGKVPAQWEGKKLVDVQPIEMLAWAPLLLLTLGLGLFPRLIFDVTTQSVIGLTRLLGG